MSNFKCTRCLHEWKPRKKGLPRVCPKCKSPYWNKEKGGVVEDIGSDQVEMKKYDHSGNLVYGKTHDGKEFWREYDSEGNCVYHRESTGFEYWRDYNENGECIFFENTNGFSWVKEYDSTGRFIRFELDW